METLSKPVACIPPKPTARSLEFAGEYVDCQKIANMTGLNRSFVWRVLNNQKSPSIDTARKICGALGMGLEEFVDACATKGAEVEALRKAEVQAHLDRVDLEDRADLKSYQKGTVPRPRAEVLRVPA